MYCSSCGEEVEDAQSASFCPNCGAALTQQDPNSTGASTVTEQTVREPNSSEVTAAETQQEEISNMAEDLPLLKGAVSGAAAYIGGYLLFIPLILGIENNNITEIIPGSNDFTFVGWAYHNAQFVDVDAPGQSFNLFDARATSGLFDLPTVLYRILPVAVLITAGYLLVRSLNVTDPTTGVKFGATITIGVPVMTAIGASVFSISSGSGTGSSSPQLLTSILIIGVVYPALCGGIGGYIAGSRTK